MKDLFELILDILWEPFKITIFMLIVVVAFCIFGGIVYLITTLGTIFFYIVAGVVGFIFVVLLFAIIEISSDVLG